MHRGKRHLGLPVVVAAAIAWSSSACASTDQGFHGDCNADLMFDGVRYEARSDLSHAPFGPRLGTADVVGCTSDKALDEANVYPVRGIDPDTAIATVKRWKNGRRATYVYVVETLPRTETPGGWPTELDPLRPRRGTSP
jgi:hypothetical protein